MNEDCEGVNMVMPRSLCRLTVDDLNFILNNNEKLESLPDPVVSSVVYRLSLTVQTQDIWKADGYIWKNEKSVPYSRQQPDFIKTYHTCVNADKKKDARCVKHVYISKNNKLDVIVCYIGNLDIATQRAHGNSKLATAHLFRCTLSSTIKKIDTLVKDMSGSKAYKHLIATNDGDDAPRNVAQCEYRRQKFLKEQRITNDEITNLLLLSFDLNSYFKLLQIQPDLLVVLIHDKMIEHFSKMVLMTKETVPLFYDTTFSLGEIYVSILAYRHVMFVEQPIIPLAILFHDFKKQRTHNRFIQILHDEIPQFSKHCVLVTDGEDALKNAFRLYYPQLDQLRCWNHLGQNIKAAAKTHYVVTQQTADVDGNDPTVLRKKKKEIITNAVDTITNLLRAPSKLDFMNEYDNISQTWPSGFRDWINNNLLPTIDEIGGWSGRERNLFNEMSGITNNPIESLNAVFKRWLAWKELSLDSLAQMFYLVNGFYVNEVKRGFCAAGGYHLRQDYINSKIDRSFLSLVTSFSPDEAVNRMKDILLKKKALVLETSDTSVVEARNASVIEASDTSVVEARDTSLIEASDTSVLEVNDTSQEQASLSISDGGVDDIADNILVSNNNDHQTSVSSSSHAVAGTFRRETLTNSARANLLNEQELVQFDTNSKVFTVRSLDQQVVHAVHMNDRKRLFRCSCPSIQQHCGHVLAVKVYLGMPMDDTGNKVNLGHERKRKRIDNKIGKAGGKQPRRCDKENNQSSSYFTSNNNTSTTNKPPGEHNPCSSVTLSTNTLSITSPFQNISNFSPSSPGVTGPKPTLIKSVRFISPTNLTILPSQQNQYMVIQPK